MSDFEQMPKQEVPKYQLEVNQEFLGFLKVEVTEVDESKPWRPAKLLKVTKADGTVVENVPANTPFFSFRDKSGQELVVTAAVAGHIDQLHIKGTDAGSKFDYDSLYHLFEDVAKKLPEGLSSMPGISDFAIEMGKNMGKEGVASLQELKAEGVISDNDLSIVENFREKVKELNRESDLESKKAFVQSFKEQYPDCKIQFQIVRDTVIVPIVNIPKRPTTKLFMVFGPGEDGKKVAYTMAPGRYMPRHPNPNQHKNKEGIIDEKTFDESSRAWFDNVMLVG